MNTKIDNYIDSLNMGDIIEFEGDEYDFIRIVEDLIICDNGHVITINDFHDDLEFGDNSLFKKYKDNYDNGKKNK